MSNDLDVTFFHKGELEIQDRLGVREQVHSYALRVIRDHMPDQHRRFFSSLPQIIVGPIDNRARPWATMVAGRPGFVTSPDPGSLYVQTQPLYGDPLADNLASGAPLGLLGIEFHTRRRNRMNGKVSVTGSDGFSISVDQSLGNCPSEGQ